MPDRFVRDRSLWDDPGVLRDLPDSGLQAAAFVAEVRNVGRARLVIGLL